MVRTNRDIFTVFQRKLSSMTSFERFRGWSRLKDFANINFCGCFTNTIKSTSVNARLQKGFNQVKTVLSLEKSSNTPLRH